MGFATLNPSYGLSNDVIPAKAGTQARNATAPYCTPLARHSSESSNPFRFRSARIRERRARSTWVPAFAGM